MRAYNTSYVHYHSYIVKRLGIFGGSFNPVHIGHCAVAEYFVHHVHLDTCVFVPTFVSPFKTDDTAVADAHRRLAMLRSVCRTNSRFAVSDIELQRRDVSYTVHTVRHFRKRYPDAELFLLIGQDLLARFTEWKEWEEIARGVTICVARRGTEYSKNDLDVIERIAALGNTPIGLFPPRIDVSSSMIRSMIAGRESLRYVVPDSVRRMIRKHGLYGWHTSRQEAPNVINPTYVDSRNAKASLDIPTSTQNVARADHGDNPKRSVSTVIPTESTE